MKKVSFMVALLAVIQILLGSRIAQAQNLRIDDRHDDRATVEEALDRAGEDIGEELEELFAQLEETAEKLGGELERWAEENSEELEAWSEKYGHKWEQFGERFERAMESIAEDQEGVWSQWAERYERELEDWSNDLPRDGLKAQDIGRFIDDNLEALSQMPLGQLVDQALDEGFGELRTAPWESLEELGSLAKDALQEPIEELADLSIEGAKARRALQRSAREMERSLERLTDDLGRNISDVDPRIRRFKELLQRDDVTEQQRQSIEDMIDAIRSSDQRPDARPRLRETERRDIDVPRRDQILERIDREKKRHAQALDDFNMDLQRSSEDSRQEQRRKLDIEWQKKDSRAPKRTDGRNLDVQPNSLRTDQLRLFRDGDGRQPRTQKQNSRRPSNRKSGRDGERPDVDWIQDDEVEPGSVGEGGEKQKQSLESLLKQIEELRKEVEELKRNRW